MKPHEQAKAWRIRRKLTLDQLSEMTGYSVPALYKFEAGARHKANGQKHSEWSWQRFQMVCAAVDAQIRTGRTFEW